jgi:XRE family aerobic/anaerobic benzoate catabolism transcriptional regulator
VREGPERPVELALLVESLDRLAPAALAQARRLLAEAFGTGAAERRRRVALIGLRGAGKSTLGRRLAAAEGVPFIELDREIERDSGVALGEIFQLYGQAAFRRYERRSLEAVIERHPAAVIATGGSLVSEPGTFELLLAACFTVWLTARPEEHMNRVIAQGDTRPMADNAEAMADLRRILAGREALYAKADATVDTAGRTIEESLAALRAAIVETGERRIDDDAHSVRLSP